MRARRRAAPFWRSCPEHSHVILLDVGGRQLSSEGIAARVDALALSGVSEISFVVGGSGGVSQGVYDVADESMSFGKITLPHNLARVVLLEQIYRAFKISRGEPVSQVIGCAVLPNGATARRCAGFYAAS